MDDAASGDYNGSTFGVSHISHRERPSALEKVQAAHVQTISFTTIPDIYH
jgi:phosphoserine aminotransferase